VDIARALAKSVARLEDGSPASPVGELIDVIVKEVEASNQSNSQGDTDADVSAKEGGTHTGRWAAVFTDDSASPLCIERIAEARHM